MEVVKMAERHCLGVMDIINYYIENTGYTFIERPIPYRLYEPLMATLGKELSLVAQEEGLVRGVIMFKKYSPMSFFEGVCEMGIYVHKDYRKKGIGSDMLKAAIPMLKENGKRMICSTVSSLNDGSIAFHKANGFRDMGAYENIGFYKETPFSVIHFQYDI